MSLILANNLSLSGPLIIDSSKVSQNQIKEILISKKFKNIVITTVNTRNNQVEYIQIINNVIKTPLYFPLNHQSRSELVLRSQQENVRRREEAQRRLDEILRVLIETQIRLREETRRIEDELSGHNFYYTSWLRISRVIPFDRTFRNYNCSKERTKLINNIKLNSVLFSDKTSHSITDNICCICLDTIDKNQLCYECKQCHKAFCLYEDQDCMGLIKYLNECQNCPTCRTSFLKSDTQIINDDTLYEKVEEVESDSDSCDEFD